MTRSSHNFQVVAAIPESIPQEAFITALHEHENVIMLQDLTTGYKEIDTTTAGATDTHFSPGDPIVRYSVSESVIIIPGAGNWGKYPITFPASFQNTPNGVKFLAHATAGVIVKGGFFVEKAGSDHQVNCEGEEGKGLIKWVLVERVTVECHSALMPFVRHSMTKAHENTCRLVVEKVVRQRESSGSGNR